VTVAPRTRSEPRSTAMRAFSPDSPDEVPISGALVPSSS
jgi:hypothetical protein